MGNFLNVTSCQDKKLEARIIDEQVRLSCKRIVYEVARSFRYWLEIFQMWNVMDYCFNFRMFLCY